MAKWNLKKWTAKIWQKGKGRIKRPEKIVVPVKKLT
jgi:hypothetical protein